MKPYYQDDSCTIYNGDCLEVMKEIDDKSIDMILCDLPYGTTACKWDTIIPFEPLWTQYKRIIKDNGAIVLTASQPFTSQLVMSNLNMFKYEWIWGKSIGANPLLCKKQPMKYHENILIFYNDLNNRKQQVDKFKNLRIYFKGLQEYIKSNLNFDDIFQLQINKSLGHRKAEHCFYWETTQWDLPTKETYQELINIFQINKWNGFMNYFKLKIKYLDEQSNFKDITFNPQMTIGKMRDKKPKMYGIKQDKNWGGAMRKFNGKENINDKYYPRSYQYFSNADQKNKQHPTQKPVALFEYLIKTYTNEGDLVLDNCIGSGTTAVACKNLGRKCIGIEISEEYVKIAVQRLGQEVLDLR